MLVVVETMTAIDYELLSHRVVSWTEGFVKYQVHWSSCYANEKLPLWRELLATLGEDANG